MARPVTPFAISDLPAGDKLLEYLHFLQYERNLSEDSLRAYSRDVADFLQFAGAEVQAFAPHCSVFTPGVADREAVRAWLSRMMDQGQRSTSVRRRLSSVRGFYKYLLRRGEISFDPLAEISGPKKEKSLPAYLTDRQVEETVETVQEEESLRGDDPFTIARNELILEMLYQTGLRRSELAALKNADVDLGQRQISVWGKGRKQRIVPFGPGLLELIRAYIEIRDRNVPVCPYFFVTLKGIPMGGQRIYLVVHAALSNIAGLSRRGPHTLRHTFATEMLNNGAELTSIKALMGHNSLTTTVRYTHTSFEKLKQLYHAHPRAQHQNDPMEIKIQAVKFTATAQLEEFTQKKMERLARFYDAIDHIEVTFKLEKPESAQNKSAAIRLVVPGNDLFAEKIADTFEEALDLAADALKHQIDKQKELKK